MNSGIYIVINKKNGKRYVGSAVSLGDRFRHHRHCLRKGIHGNGHLQNAWNKYGEGAFEFEVLERWEPEFLVSMEQWWMNILAPEYNIAPVAGSQLGMTRTAESRAKMSAAAMGRTFTKEHKANLAAAGRGSKHSEETKAKISATKKGRKQSDEHKAKLSAVRKGKPWTVGRRAAYEARCSL